MMTVLPIAFALAVTALAPADGAAMPQTRQRVAVPRTAARAPAVASPAAVLTAEHGAVRVYPWLDGSVYRLRTAPGQVSEIGLQPGESLVSVAAGDTARWIIGDTTSGTGTNRRTHVLVKPTSAGLATNLLIATDRRLYRIALRSQPRAATAGLAWTYPEDALLALARAAAEARNPSLIASGIAVEHLNFGYAIGGDRPPWRPLRVFDDGRQVFIQFPEGFGRGEAPPLFVVGPAGRAELVNYRVAGRYYVVDRLFGRAELRLGERRQQVVTITAAGAKPSRGAK